MICIPKFIALFLLILSFSTCYAKDDDCLNFDKNIKVFTDLEKLLGDDGKRVKNTLDLNGDGVKVRVVLLSVSEKSKPAKGVNAKEATNYLGEFEYSPHIAIGIIHSATQDKPCERFIISLVTSVFAGDWDGTIDNFYINGEPLITMPPCEFKNIGEEYDMFCIMQPINGNIFALYWDKEKEKYQEGNQVFEEP
jgi:hypothetical protein